MRGECGEILKRVDPPADGGHDEGRRRERQEARTDPAAIEREHEDDEPEDRQETAIRVCDTAGDRQGARNEERQREGTFAQHDVGGEASRVEQEPERVGPCDRRRRDENVVAREEHEAHDRRRRIPQQPADEQREADDARQDEHDRRDSQRRERERRHPEPRGEDEGIARHDPVRVALDAQHAERRDVERRRPHVALLDQRPRGRSVPGFVDPRAERAQRADGENEEEEERRAEDHGRGAAGHAALIRLRQ